MKEVIFLLKNKTLAITFSDAKDFGCPYCGLSVFPGWQDEVKKKGISLFSCHDDDCSNGCEGGCGNTFYIFTPGNERLVPTASVILNTHPRQGNPVHDDGQQYRNDNLYHETRNKYGGY